MDTNIPTPEVPKVDTSVANATQVTGQIVTTSNNAESAIGSVSVRGIIALVLVLGVVVYPILKIIIPDQIFNLTTAAVAFYFGRNQSK